MSKAQWKLAKGYRWAGLHCGIRPDPKRKDLALIVSDLPAASAGVFTQNQVCAAPVQVSRQRVPREDARGIVICSGNANACTGEQGLADARQMCLELANRLNVTAEEVLVCSTGIIGRPLPMPNLVSGIDKGMSLLSEGADALEAAAQAILTTDTCIKVATAEFPEADQVYRITGLAKGAAMIGPNMATMLGVIVTDAAVDHHDLQASLRKAVEQTFNCISVEGHTSTNDTVLLLANGAAAGPQLAGPALTRFQEHLTGVAEQLAQAIVNDAEGATHVLCIDVEGMHNDADAKRIAQAVANSALVKTALFGCDPNWGRILSAAGYAGVPFAEKDASLWLGETQLYDRGTPLVGNVDHAAAYLRHHRHVTAKLLFTLGAGRCRFWTSDLTYDYVRLNAEYTT